MLSRRKFLILITASAAAVATGKSLTFDEKKERKSELAKYEWGMVIDVDKCTKCIKEIMDRTGIKDVEKIRPPCIVECDKANNVPKSDKYYYSLIRIYEVREREDAEPLFFPIMCQECEHPACVQVCLTKASYRREDGIIVVDLHRCIGCRYCMIACPYNARRYLYDHPEEHLSVVNPEAPIRKHGVVMKCEFCLWKIDRERSEGKDPKPVCVEACPYNALIFGNIKDPNSEISKILKTSKVITLRAHLGTNPRVKYKW
ncbi:MAG TPA: 4Fe-4S dicluster domain-containing protein [Archaeoglobus profundus]|nr:4Fe-4S dicluster domain-containing protein [Archaeoglobus profundus]